MRAVIARHEKARRLSKDHRAVGTERGVYCAQAIPGLLVQVEQSLVAHPPSAQAQPQQPDFLL
jgi:hypothetical protein